MNNGKEMRMPVTFIQKEHPRQKGNRCESPEAGACLVLLGVMNKDTVAREVNKRKR